MTIFKEDDIYSQTRKALKKNHIKDALRVLYILKLMIRFLKILKKINLTINKYIPIETFYCPKYVFNEPFMKVPVTQNDDTHLRFRKFKTYGPCTKKFEKKKRENQNFEEMFS